MSSCYFCGSEQVETIFDIEECPIAGNFLNSPEEDTLLPLDILICKECGIGQVAKNLFLPKETLFKTYFYNTHSIKTLRDFFYDQAYQINNRSDKRLKVLEIGGNSCPLGERLIDLGHYVVNVDPSDTALNYKPDNVVLINDFFNAHIASVIKGSVGKVNIVYTANNFAHMEDIVSVIEGINDILFDDGELIIQVQDFEYLLEETCFPFFYHEHLFYYTAHTLANMLSNYGFVLTECTKNNIHGRSVNCIFKKSSEKVVVDPKIEDLINKVEDFKDKVGEDNWEDFLESDVALDNCPNLEFTGICGAHFEHGYKPVIQYKKDKEYNCYE